MKKIIISSALTLAVSGLAGCASGPSFDDLAAEAEKEMKIAKKMNYLWRDTGKILKNAKKAKAAGDTKKARKLATEAIDQAKMAQAQAKAEANPKVRF